jgi:iron complex transport system permease protein
MLKKIVVVIIVAIITIIICPFIGMEVISPLALFDKSELAWNVFFSLRLPRVLTAFTAGAGLALCGTVFQAMFRNPLAEPFTLGVSSGASFGAACMILTGASALFPGVPVLSIGAFLGAFLAMTLVYSFSRIPKRSDSYSMLLSGIVVSFFFSSLLMFSQYISSVRDSFHIVRWLMGGVDTFGYQSFLLMFFVVVTSIIIIVRKLPELDLLLTGDDIAKSRGVAVAKTRLILLVATTLIVGSIVSVCGPIGFVGLIVPYAARSLFPMNHRILGGVSCLLGGSFLVVCDTVARTIIAPVEIPVGVITSLIGAPFFLWILINRSSHSQRGFF